MTDARAKRLEDLFRLGVEVPRAERGAFLARHCADDPALARELRDLLAQDDAGTKPYLASPVLSAWSRAGETGAGHAQASDRDAGERGDRIGRYRILHQLGEGGMGVVYLAEQEEPVRREVALKIVKLGMDTRRVVARFENERQALALMDHPGIARIFDGGATENGRPYFVMEYVEGSPLTEFCDLNELGVADRLALFVRVCEAVQHAHAKGIVHRDLKPSNVLVAVRDGVPAPKVIDFGIARATADAKEGREARERPTRASEVIGTYAYMSPEQADPAGGEVGARSDVYALGVMLYELLTGMLPYDADLLTGKSPSEVSRLLADVDPPAPSTKVTRQGSASAALAARRGGLDPRGLARRTSGDLDWITLKAMERDPARRYASAYELALDVRRHLANQAVCAGPPSRAYRLRKYVRRHRTGVSAAAALALSVASGIAGTALGFREASSEARAAREQLASAESRLENIQDMGGFMLEAFRLADPESSWHADESSLMALMRLRDHVAEVFREDPLGEARVRVLFGRMLRGRGELDLARVDLDRAGTLQRQHHAPLADRYETGREIHRLSVEAGGYADFAAGLAYADLGVAVLEAAAPKAGAAAAQLVGDAKSLELARIPADLARLEQAYGELLAREALVVADVVGLAGGYLGLHLAFPEAEPLLEAAVRLRADVLGATHPEVVLALADLVEHELRRGRPAVARGAVAARLQAFEERFPGGHWTRAEVESMLGECLSLLGEAERAEDLLVRAGEVLAAERGPRSRAAVHARLRLREHYERSGQTLRAHAFDDAVRSPLALARDRHGAWTRTFETLGADGAVADALIALLDAADGSAADPLRAREAAQALARLLREQQGTGGAGIARVLEDAFAAVGLERAPGDAFALALGEALSAARALAAGGDPVRLEAGLPRAPEHALERAESQGTTDGAHSIDGASPSSPHADAAPAPAASQPLVQPAEWPFGGEETTAPEAASEAQAAALAVAAWTTLLDPGAPAEAYYAAWLQSCHVVKLEPDVTLYAEVQALSVARLGYPDEALWYLDRIEAGQSLDAVGWAVRSLAHLEAGRAGDAARALETAWAIGFAHPELLPPDAELLILEILRLLGG